jgi:preprotein translocase subunit SecY
MAQANPAAALANIYKTPELWEKIKFTFICLAIYRLGSVVTAPGVDVIAISDFFQNQGSQGLLGLYDLFVGGQLSRATVFALGIMPYISASIFVQIAGAVIPTVEKMQKDEDGRKKADAVHSLCDGHPRHGAGVGLCDLHRIAAGRRGEPGLLVQGPDGPVPDHGRDLRHVAG